jgi:hypothetical protein
MVGRLPLSVTGGLSGHSQRKNLRTDFDFRYQGLSGNRKGFPLTAADDPKQTLLDLIPREIAHSFGIPGALVLSNDETAGARILYNVQYFVTGTTAP